MFKFILAGIASAVSFFGLWGSYSGWGLQKPEIGRPSVKHGSTHVRRGPRGFYLLGRSHGHYGGK